MAEAAIRPMTVDEFLRWEDGTDTRYELLAGFPVAMAPPAERHGTLVARVARHLENGLVSRRPWRATSEAGILHPDRADTFFVANLGVTCAPDQGRQHLQDPILLVEVLSPTTERRDRRTKIPAYQRIASVEEILLVAADGRYAELHRRQGGQWLIQIIRGANATIPLASIGVEIAMAELYEGFTFEDEEP